ncbi:E3 SUMO-protein ligase ZBED1 [Nothobranchius furzeri]|uniref:E3 SUMO-protein ligase ZBED1 n=1 Tax=Nothobranchius furzeri TaxID=105023 RepID=UPI003904C5F4
MRDNERGRLRRRQQQRRKSTQRMRRTKRSAVWSHFTLVNDNDAKCTICGSILKYNKSTTSLNYHLSTSHSAVLQTASGTQPTIAMALGRRVCDSTKAEGITQRICNMVTTDMLPINVVEGQGFQELIKYVEPGYNIPSRTTITTRLEASYAKKKTELRTQLATANMALTTDCWTSLTTESYITVTCHYIEPDWRVKSAVLLTESITVRHTADNLADKLNQAVETWGLAGRVVACVHDNARNIVSANSPTRVNWHSVPCFAHTLQLAINDGFTTYINRVIIAASRLVQHFNHSSLANIALKAKQQQMQLPSHKLIQSCKTRWNSVSEMFNRLTEQRWAVSAVLSDRTVTKLSDARTLELRDEYWQLMEDVAPVLETLKCATTVMSAETEVSVSDTYPITFSLINVHLKTDEEDTSKVGEFKSRVCTSLSERMKIASDDLMSTPPMIATMLDPRHKHLGFLTPPRRVTAHAKLLEVLAETEAEAECKSATSADAIGGQQELVGGRAVPVQAAGLQRRSAYALLMGENYTTRSTNDVEKEVDSFLKDPPPLLDSSPTTWWKVNEGRFPRLANLARKYLAIPGTSVPSERVFSAAGLTVNRLRTRLTPDHVDLLIFLNKNR